MTEEPKEKIEDIVYEIFTKGNLKSLIARDILIKYRELGHEVSTEYREEIIEKYMQSKDTLEKSRRRIADVFSKLRKAGRYADAYTWGENTAVGVKKKPLEKTPSTATPITPSTVSSIHSSITPSTIPSILPSVPPSTVPSTLPDTRNLGRRYKEYTSVYSF